MKLTKSIITAGLFLFFGANAWADSGTYETVTSLTSNWTTIEHLDGTVTVGSQSGTVTVIESSGEPYEVGESSYFECLAYIRKTSAGMDLDGSCTGTNPAGDKTFVQTRRRAGDIAEGGGGEGISTIVGGTGQREGITGRCAYKIDYLQDHKSVSKSKCSWQRP
jgi:hypothetical protein